MLPIVGYIVYIWLT